MVTTHGDMRKIPQGYCLCLLALTYHTLLESCKGHDTFLNTLISHNRHAPLCFLDVCSLSLLATKHDQANFVPDEHGLFGQGDNSLNTFQ